MLSRSTIDAVNDLDLEQVIGKYVELKRSGASYKGKSPFTDEKSGSFFVNPAKGVWKCFSTGKGGGSAVSFVMAKNAMTYPEAIKEIASTHGIQIEFDDAERSKKYVEKQERIKNIHEVNALALEYFTQEINVSAIPPDKLRATPFIYEKFSLGYAPDSFDGLLKFLKAKGISEEMILKCGLASKSEKGKVYDFFRGRIMFPIFTESGKLIGFSGRNIIQEKEGQKIPKILNTPETEAYSKSHSLLGIHLAKEAIRKMGFAVKVEGNFDVTSLHSLGFPNAIAPLGTAFTADQMRIIKRYADVILLFVDNDKAGKNKILKDTINLLEEGFKVYLFIPPFEGMDPDDFAKSKVWKIDENHNEFQDEVESTKLDAVEYLVNNLYAKSSTTIEKAAAEAQTAEILAAIPDAQLRNAYVKLFAKEYKLERKVVEEKVKVHIAAKAVLNEEEVDGFILPRHLSKDEIQDFSEFGFYSEVDSKKIGYYFPKGNSFKDFERVSNFIIRPIFQVENKDDSKRIVEIRNPHKKVIIEITNKALLSLQAFREAIGNYGNFYFRGNAMQHQALYIKLMAQFPFCSEIRTLGWNKSGNFFAFADGIVRENHFKKIDPFGIVEAQDRKFFLPAFSEINSNVEDEDDYFEADRFLRYRPNKHVTMNVWARKMERVYGINGIWATCFFVACCFRDIIFSNTQIFPILFLVGQPQTGKSTCARSLATIFTADQPAFNLSTGTAVGFQRRLARLRNCFIWLDEYRNDIDMKRIQALKGGFDGTGAEKGIMTNDNRTKSTKINSGFGISGQHYPTIDENALLTRSILLEFTRKQEELSTEDVKEYEELNKWQMEGLSNLIIETIAYRDYFNDEWRESYQKIYKRMSTDLGLEHYEGRIMQSITVMLTTLFLIGSKLNFHYPFEYVYNLGKEHILSQSSLSSESNVLSGFWKMLEFMSLDGLIRNDEDYKVVNLPSLKVRAKGDKEEVLEWKENKNVLFLRFQRVFPKYAENHRKQTGENGHPETSLKSYMKADKKAFLGNVKAVEFGTGQTSAYAFDYDKLVLSLKDVHTGSFNPFTNNEKDAIQHWQTKIELEKDDDVPF